MNQNISLSNILIILSIIATIIVSLDTRFFVFGMNRDFLDQGIYHIYVIQFFSSQFLHWWFLHVLMNSIFIYYFGNQVEYIIGRQKYLLLFICNSIFIGIGLTLFSSPYVNTVGMSGFAMAVMAYYTLYLKSIKNPEYTGWITAIVINIAIGLVPGISLLWHLFGVIFWGVYYLWNYITKKRG